MSILPAAGAVVFRDQLTCIIHRPHIGDWTIAKGKPDKHEYLPATAVREVEEETGLRIRLGHPLSNVSYPLDGYMKVVEFWVGHELGSTEFVPNDEVDELAWLSVDEACTRLSDPAYAALLQRAAAAPATTPVIIARHAKATARKDFDGIDVKRPLAKKGLKQADALAGLFGAFGVLDVVTSSAARCVQTVSPYATAQDLPVTALDALTEEAAETDPGAVGPAVREVLSHAATTGRPALICGHRPVLPAMLAAMGLADRPFSPGDALVAHVDQQGVVIATEYWPAR